MSMLAVAMRKIRTIFLVVVGIILIGFALPEGITQLNKIGQYVRAGKYRRATAIVEEASVSRNVQLGNRVRVRYSPVIRARFIPDGTQDYFYVERFAIHEPRFRSSEKVQTLLAEYGDSQHITIYYDARNPHRSLIRRDFVWDWAYRDILLPFFLALGGFASILAAVFFWKTGNKYSFRHLSTLGAG